MNPSWLEAVKEGFPDKLTQHPSLARQVRVFKVEKKILRRRHGLNKGMGA